MVRGCLAVDGIDSVPVPSGSKGIHVYGGLDGSRDSDTVTAYGKSIADVLAERHPDLVVTNIRKVVRKGRILIDWSQNRAAKTTVAPYSLRGRLRPTVACPRTWDELLAGLEQVEHSRALRLLKVRPCPFAALMSRE